MEKERKRTLQKIIDNNYFSCKFLGDAATGMLNNNAVLNPYQKCMAARGLSNGVGDELSNAISDSLDNNSDEMSIDNIRDIYFNSNVVDELVLRRVNEKDYYDYLNGVKPISKVDNENFYLVKEYSDSVFSYRIDKK